MTSILVELKIFRWIRHHKADSLISVWIPATDAFDHQNLFQFTISIAFSKANFLIQQISIMGFHSGEASSIKMNGCEMANAENYSSEKWTSFPPGICTLDVYTRALSLTLFKFHKLHIDVRLRNSLISLKKLGVQHIAFRP